MSFTQFSDFGQLYRAAFAEADDQKKSALLREVERIIQSKAADIPNARMTAAKAA